MRKLLIPFSIIFILGTFLAIKIYKKINKPYGEIINKNWAIELPKAYKEIYSANSEASFTGDGERYHIFEYDNVEEIDRDLYWESDKNAEIESAVKKVLDSLKIPMNKFSDFKGNYKYFTTTKADNSKIYFILDNSTRRLYIIEYIL